MGVVVGVVDATTSTIAPGASIGSSWNTSPSCEGTRTALDGVDSSGE